MLQLRHLLFVGCACVACSSDPAPFRASLSFTQGQESDTLSVDAQDFRVRAVRTDGTKVDVARTSWPPTGVDISGMDSKQSVAFEGVAMDAKGHHVVRGATVFHPLWLRQDATIPVFLGAVGRTSRPVGGMQTSRTAGHALVVQGRYLVTTGGGHVLDEGGASIGAQSFDGYDLGAWAPLSGIGELPRVPDSIFLLDAGTALIVGDDGASWYDFAGGYSGSVAAPAGLKWSEVSGGSSLYGWDGSIYLVGATRASGEPTDGVLVVTPDGLLQSVHARQARLDAAMAWVKDKGVVLVGGSADGPGAEFIGGPDEQFQSLDFPPDDTSGGAAVSMGDGRILLVGGQSAAGPHTHLRIMDTSCQADCHVTQLDASIPVALSTCVATRFASGEVLVVGESGSPTSDGGTVLYRISHEDSSFTVSEVPLRDARAGAFAARLYGDTVAVVGGTRPDGTPAKSIEIYVAP